MNNDDEIIERLTRYLSDSKNFSKIGPYDVSQEMMNELVNYTYGKYKNYEYVIEDDGEKTLAVHSKNTDNLDTLADSLQRAYSDNVKASAPPVVKMLNISNLAKIREQFFCIEEEVDSYTFYNNFQDYVIVQRKINGLSDNEPYVTTTLYVGEVAKKNDKITLKENTKPPIEQVKEQLNRIATYGR